MSRRALPDWLRRRSGARGWLEAGGMSPVAEETGPGEDDEITLPRAFDDCSSEALRLLRLLLLFRPLPLQGLQDPVVEVLQVGFLQP